MDQILMIGELIGATLFLILVQWQITKRNQHYRAILPILCLLFSIMKSIPNFKNAFYMQFSLNAFLLCIVYIMILNIPTFATLMIARKQSK